MRYTLLELTQMILSAMDSDEVNSISDTIESNQVALLLKGVYYDCATDLDLPEDQGLIELTASGDNLLPVLMTVPTTCIRVSDISYDTRGSDTDTIDLPRWKKLQFLPLQEFIQCTQAYRSDETYMGSMQVTSGNDTFEFIHRNNLMPTYYTAFDDQQLIFDSYDNTIDTTLQKSKTLCYGARYKEFLMQDNFTPSMDPTQFSYYLNKAKVRAFAELKQAPNQEAAGEARRQKIVSQKRKHKAPHLTAFEKRPNYGR